MNSVEKQDVEITRGETGVRILLTLLFFLIAEVIQAVIAVCILFELIYALVTTSPPAPRVRAFANRVVSYYYRIGRYLTYAEPCPPFPFREFPPEVEPLESPAEEAEEP